jgi:hypothetical protein
MGVFLLPRNADILKDAPPPLFISSVLLRIAEVVGTLRVFNNFSKNAATI